MAYRLLFPVIRNSFAVKSGCREYDFELRPNPASWIIRHRRHRIGLMIPRSLITLSACLYISFLALFAIFFLDGRADPQPSSPKQINVAEPAPLPAVAFDGQQLNLMSQPGWKVVYFWSGACPCVTACERWTFLPLAKRYQGRVHFYAVVSGRFDLDLPRDQLRQKVAARHLPYPVLLDPHHEVAQALGATVTPEAFLLDPQNRVIFAGVPDDSRRYLSRTGRSGVTQTYLSHAIAQALAGRPVTAPQVKDQGCIIPW